MRRRSMYGTWEVLDWVSHDNEQRENTDMNEISNMALYRPSRKSDEAIVPRKPANKAPSGASVS